MAQNLDFRHVLGEESDLLAPLRLHKVLNAHCSSDQVDVAVLEVRGAASDN